MKISIKILVIFMSFIMTACSLDTSSGYNDLIRNNNQTTPPETEINIPEQIEQPIFEQSPDSAEQPIALPPDVYTGFTYMEFFAPIINAYAKLEQSEFLIDDDDLITGSLLEIQLAWGRYVSESLLESRAWLLHRFREHEMPNLVYSLHSMSGFLRPEWNRPELIIGVEVDGIIEIISIYAIEIFDFRSAAEPDNYSSGVRNVFSVANRDIISTTLTISADDFSILTTTWLGNAGETYEYFQVVGPGIGVGWVEMIKTTLSQQRFSVCYIGPCDFCNDGFTGITEEEYFEVIRNLGTAGFDVVETIEARHVNLEWTAVHSGWFQ